MNNRTAAAKSHRAALEALRDTLAEKLDTTEAQIHAQLAAQYRATLSELAAMPEDEPDGGSDDEGETVDEEWDGSSI